MLFNKRAILVLSMVLAFVLMLGTYFLVQSTKGLTPARYIDDAYALAQLSGSYDFMSEVTQVTAPEPRLGNTGIQSASQHLIISGTINESAQTMQMRIENADGRSPALEIRRAQGKSYVRQGPMPWREFNTAADMSMNNTLMYLSGIKNIATATDGHYTFVFDGELFAKQFTNNLQRSARHGLQASQEWYDIAQGKQLRNTAGNGTIVLDGDGLPQQMTLALQTPANGRMGEIHSTIKTSFFNFARSGIALHKLYNTPLTTIGRMINLDPANIAYMAWVLGVLVICGFGIYGLYMWRNRIFGALSVFVIVLLIQQPFADVPHAQAATPNTTDPVPPSDSTTQAAVFDPFVSPLQTSMGVSLPAAGAYTNQKTVSANQTTQLHPRVNATATAQPTSTPTANEDKNNTGIADSIDGDGDKISDNQEALLGTDPRNPDSDGDGLTDYQEIQIGTDPLLSDSDIDGISDFVEVTVPSLNLDDTASHSPTALAGIQTQLYSNPLSDDTNSDGVSDGVECPEHMDVSESVKDCADSNGDHIPDFLTNDNDGDGVPDSVDFDMNTKDATVYGSDAKPFPLQLSGVMVAAPVVTEIQFRPVNSKLLNLNGAVYDWPSGDTQGQVQRTFDTTFAAPGLGTIPTARDSNAANGDVQVTAMAEFTVPIVNGDFGGLPKNTNPWSLGSDTTPPAWLDMDKLKPYGISAAWNADNSSIILTMPVSNVYDDNGTVVAYKVANYSESVTPDWLKAQQMRLLWVVVALQDQCSDQDASCTTRIQSLGAIQTYYSDFVVTGIKATEHNGYEGALIYDDVSQQVHTPENRYLFLTQVNQVLTSNFVYSAYLDITTTDSVKNRSIVDIFDSSKNSTVMTNVGTPPVAKQTTQLFGVDPTATRVKTFNYRTSIEAIKVYANDLPQVLCSIVATKYDAIYYTANAGKVTDYCINRNTDPTVKNPNSTDVINGLIRKRNAVYVQCLGKTDSITCNPGVVMVSQSKERSAGLLDGDNNVITFHSEAVITRSTTGQIFQINRDATGWDALSDTNKQLIADKLPTANTVPTMVQNANSEIWNLTFANIIPSSSLIVFAQLFATTKLSMTKTKLESMRTNSKITITDLTRNWTDKATNYISTYASIFYTEYLNSSTNSTSEKQSRNNKNREKAAKVITCVNNMTGFNLECGSNAAVAQIAKNFALGDNTVKNIGYAVEAVSIAINLALNIALTLKPISDNKAKALFVLQVTLTWAVAGLEITNAKYDWQKGKIASAAVGQTIAMAIIFAISTIEPEGAFVALAILAVDLLASTICRHLSDSDQESPAGQWLCGGLTGLLAKIFTFYDANLIVDPDNEASHVSVKVGWELDLANLNIGFRVGNGWRTSFIARDYIKRMPWPASFGAMDWKSQWDDVSTRNATFAYTLDTVPHEELVDQIRRGDQENLYYPTENLCGNKPTDQCREKEQLPKNWLSWSKNVQLSYTDNFTVAGINRRLSGLQLTQAFRVPMQECVFYLLGSECKIKVHSDTKITDLNEMLGTTIYDIFPETIDEFATMADKGDGYSFAWGLTSSNPSFPTFKDADNDGLPLLQELSVGTSDNNADTDGDGITDAREVALGYPPLAMDSDKDGLTDYQELQIGTDPAMPDTDGDGLLDGEEVVHIVNGRRMGGWDVTYDVDKASRNLMTWVSSDPLTADGDGDGIIDLRERILGWSPYAKNSGDIVSAQGIIREGGVVAVTAAKQSSTYLSADAQLAVDGNRDSEFNNGSVTHTSGTEVNPWWQATLTNPTMISAITVYNRNTLQNRLKNAIVFLSNSDMGTSIDIAANKTTASAWRHLACNNQAATCTTSPGAVQTVTFNPPVQAQYVRVQLEQFCTQVQQGSGNGGGSTREVCDKLVPLSLAEVEISDYNPNPNLNDLIVRPGDQIQVDTTITNKLLGRDMQGTLAINTQATYYEFPPRNPAGFSLPKNTSLTTRQVLTIPGEASDIDGNTRFVQGCAFSQGLLCLKLDDRASTAATMTWSEQSGVNRKVTCQNCPSIDANAVNDGWLFTHTDQTAQRLNIADAAVSNTLSRGDFSVSLWVKLKGTAMNIRPLLTNADGTFSLELRDQKPTFVVGSTMLQASTALGLGSAASWTHLLFRYNAGYRQIYVNGVLQVYDSTPIVIPTSIGLLSIAGRQNSAGNPSYYELNGNLRDVQMYAYALSEPQMQSLAHGCSDALLLACFDFAGTTVVSQLTDNSLWGQRNGITLQCNSSCPTYVANVLTLSGSTLQFGAGTGMLLGNRDFTIASAFKVSGTATYTILQSSNSSNPFALQIKNLIPTLAFGGQTITTAAIVANTWYYIVARNQGSHITLALYRLSGNVVSNSVGDTATSGLIISSQLDDPLQIAGNGLTLDSMAIYRSAIDDNSLLANAKAALLNQMGTETSSAPQSDTLQISADVRPKVIVKQSPPFEYMPSFCYPPDGVDVPAVCLPMNTKASNVPYNFGVNAANSATQSSTLQDNSTLYGASRAADNSVIDSKSITKNEVSPWWQLDLGAAQLVRTVTIYNRPDVIWEFLGNGKTVVSLSNNDLKNTTSPTDKVNATIVGDNLVFGYHHCEPTWCNDFTITPSDVQWRYVQCDPNTTTHCYPGAYNTARQYYTVTFDPPVNARYVRLQMTSAVANTLNMSEVVVNESDAVTVSTVPPTISNGVTYFGADQTLRMSNSASQNLVNKAYTMTFKVKLSDTTGTTNILQEIRPPSGENTLFSLYVRDGHLVSDYSCNYMNVNDVLQPNRWYDVTIKHPVTGERQIFLDGVGPKTYTDWYGSCFPIAKLASAQMLTFGGDGKGKPFWLSNFQIHRAALDNPPLLVLKSDKEKVYSVNGLEQSPVSSYTASGHDASSQTQAPSYTTINGRKGLTLGANSKGLSLGNIPLANDLSNFTMSAWIYPTNCAKNQAIFGDEDFFNLTTHPSRSNFNINIRIPSIAGYSPSWNNLDTGIACVTNQWQSVNVTYDGTTLTFWWKLLGDTAFRKKTWAATGKMSDANSNPTTIGMSSAPYFDHFVGTIDDVALYNRVRYEVEMGIVQTNDALTSIRNENTAEFVVPFDEPGDSKSFTSVITSGLTLNCTAACPLSGINGRDERAVRFSGMQALDFTADSSPFAETTLQSKDFSLGVWIKPARYNIPIIGDKTNLNTPFQLGIDLNGKITFTHAIACASNSTTQCRSVPVLSSTAVPIDKWSYVLVSYDGTADRIFVNGNKVYEGVAALVVAPVFALTNDTPLLFAINNNLKSYTYADWDNTTASRGTVAPIITTVAGRSALKMEANSQGLDLGNIPLANGLTNFTMSAWIYPDSCVANRAIFGDGDFLNLTTHPSNTNFNINIRGTSLGWVNIDTTIACVPQKWQQVSVTYDGTNLVFRRWLDNVWGRQTWTAPGVIVDANVYPTTIGNSPYFRHFVGGIDDVAIYPRTLNESELLQSNPMMITANQDTLVGKGYIGDMDELRINPKAIIDPNDVQAIINLAPNWNLRLEDTVKTLLPNTPADVLSPTLMLMNNNPDTYILNGQVLTASIGADFTNQFYAGTVPPQITTYDGRQALTFTNQSFGYRLGNHALFNGSQAFTFSTWINPSDASNWLNPFRPVLRYIYGKENSFNLLFDSATQNLLVDFNGTSFTRANLDSGIAVKFNSWQFVAVTYDGNKLRLLVREANDTTWKVKEWDAPGSMLDTSDYPITIGQGKYYDHFIGAIDDVILYNRVLSEADFTKFGVNDFNNSVLTFPVSTAAVTSTASLTGIYLPEETETRTGIARTQTRATCLNTGITDATGASITCPAEGAVGMAGYASMFNGKNTMLTVMNPNTVMSTAMQAAGTIQLMVRPDPITTTQTLLSYNDDSVNGLRVQINNSYPVITINGITITSTNKLASAWNQLSLSYGPEGFRYYQNGVIDTKAIIYAPITVPNLASGRLTLGGYVKSATLREPFSGGIDDVTFTPGSMARPKVFRIARSQFAQSMTKTDIGALVIDADNPTVNIDAPTYANKLPVQIAARTSDASSTVTSANMTIIAPDGGTRVSTAPACVDVAGGSAFCPTFSIADTTKPVASIEGAYTVKVQAFDVVNNTRTVDKQILVDLTPPTIAINPPTKELTSTESIPTKIYHIETEPNSTARWLTLDFNASDPQIQNVVGKNGSGVKQVTVMVRDLAGRELLDEPVAARNSSGAAWQARINLPFGNPTGFYQVIATVRDQMDNERTVTVAGVSNPIEVDNLAPRAYVANPDPNISMNTLIGMTAMTGRVSDYNDGRAPLQRDLRIKLDFEGENGDQFFDNHADAYFASDCTICPVIAYENGRRVARMNVDNPTFKQSLFVHNASVVITGTYSAVVSAKISDVGTILSVGPTNNPRLRVRAEKSTNDGDKFQIVAYRGNKSLKSINIAKDVWQRILVSEDGATFSLAVGAPDVRNMTVVSTTIKGIAAPAVLKSDLLIGAIYKSNTSELREDHFKGYLDDILVSRIIISPIDLVSGREIARGSGANSVRTRINMTLDGSTSDDTLGKSALAYYPFNEIQLPAIDTQQGVRSQRCASNMTAQNVTCPASSDGFEGSALALRKASDGVNLNQRITQIPVTVGLHVRAGTESNGAIMQITGDTANITLSLTELVPTVTVTSTDGSQTINMVGTASLRNNEWHHLTLYVDNSSGNIVVTMLLDGNGIGSATIAGTITQLSAVVLGSTNQTSAVDTFIDDVAIFNGILGDTDVRNLAYGFDPVYYQPFDEPNIAPTQNLPEASIYHATSFYESGDALLGVTQGQVGAYAMHFDGNDFVTSPDAQGRTIVTDSHQPWSIATWVVRQASSDTTLINGKLNGTDSAYTVQLVAGKIRVNALGFTLDAPTSYVAPYHVAASADGTTARLYINGAEVATTSIAPATQTPSVSNVAISRADYATQSSTILFVGQYYGARLAVDNNTDGNFGSASVTHTDGTFKPWWQIDLGAIYNIASLNIFNRTDCCNERLTDYYVLVSNKPFDASPDVSIEQRIRQSTWWAYHGNAVEVLSTQTPPINTMGRYVWIQINHFSVMSLAEVQVNVAPEIIIGQGFNGDLDDVRIYRRHLSAADVAALAAMGWQSATLTQRIDGYDWQQSTPANIEGATKLQVQTTDNLTNISVAIADQTVWQGQLDTRAPRIDAGEKALVSTGNYTYSVTIDDANLVPQMIQTPCGARAVSQFNEPSSLWYRARGLSLDGQHRQPTQLTIDCTLSATPEVIRRNTFAISNTTNLVAGDRFIYSGSFNRIDILDAQREDAPIVESVPITGTVSQLLINPAKTILYAVSSTSPTSNYLLNVFTISNGTAQLTNRRSYTLLRSDIPAINAIALTQRIVNSNTIDAYLLLLGTTPSSKITVVNVANLDPTKDNITVVSQYAIDGQSYAIDATADVIAVAQGAAGVNLYRISDTGRISQAAMIPAVSYANHVQFHGDDLLIVDDDEAIVGGVEPTSTNMLRVITAIASRDSTTGSATISDTLNDRYQYVYTSPFNSDIDRTYRIREITPYVTGDILIVGNDADNPQNGRVSLMDTSGLTPTVRSDHAFTMPGAFSVAAARNDVLMLAPTTAATTRMLMAFQISDRRINSKACDRAGNCMTQVATTRTAPSIRMSAPTINAVAIINTQAVYTTTNQLVQVRGEAPTGISQMRLMVDGVQVGPLWTAPLSTTQTISEQPFAWNASPGVHSLFAEMVSNDTQTITTTPITVAVDTMAPQFKSEATYMIASNQFINGFAEVTGVITEDTGLSNLTIVDQTTSKLLYVNFTQSGNTIRWRAYYPQIDTALKSFVLQLTATDRAGRISKKTLTYQIDSDPPEVIAPAFASKAGTVLTQLIDGSTISRTTGLDLVVNWQQIKDASSIALQQLEYSVQTITQTQQYTVPVTGLSSAPLITREASKIRAKLRLRDSFGNESVTDIGTAYVDNVAAPDYTAMTDATVYDGWINRSCTVLGNDDRVDTATGAQQFAVTWDSQALRLNWQGADWNNDGDLFIYLDTQSGGTVAAYRPAQFVRSVEDTMYRGNAWLTLPSDMAGRTVSNTTSAALSTWMKRLATAQKGIRSTTVEGADYAIYIDNRDMATLVQWNGSVWVPSATPVTYGFSNVAGINNSDIRIPFSAIGYTPSQPLGVFAVATAEDTLLPWATFPTTNPIHTELNDQKIVITPFLNSYAWNNLTTNTCARTTAKNADSVQINASLTSTPNGINSRGIADNIANADPDAIAQSINDTLSECIAMPIDSWCQVVAQLQNNTDAGSTLLQGFNNLLVSQQAPTVGDNAVVTYTLRIQNTGPRPSHTIYGLVNTFGGIWITSGNSSSGDGVIGGGLYSHHPAAINNYRDYAIVKVNPLAPNAIQSLTITTVIDPRKSQASGQDRVSSAAIAKLELRLTDSGTSTSVDNARTIEWLNAAVRIDSQAPSQVVPNSQNVIAIGNARIGGRVTDDSSVSAVLMEYYSDVSSSRRSINCGAAQNSLWECGLTIPSSWNIVYYRVRASDRYGQMNGWSMWYRAQVDRDTPTYSLNDATQTLLTSSYVSGSAIALSGLVSDTSSIAAVNICDETIGTCSNATANGVVDSQVITQTVNTVTPITAQPCSATELDSYTRYPVTVTDNTYSRIASMTATVHVSHPTASEVTLWLKSPSGTLIPLVVTERPHSADLNVRFTDRASNSMQDINGVMDITADATNVRPNGAFATLTNEIIRGTWYLLGCDTAANGVNGSITQVALEFTTNSPQHSQASNWNYTIANTTNQDGIPRTLKLWATDGANYGPSSSYTFKVDTVAPVLNVTQVNTEILNGESKQLLTGTANDGGVVNRITANIYADATKVSSFDIPFDTVALSAVDARVSYLIGQTRTAYTWQFSLMNNDLPAGTYTVQVEASDIVGNTQVSTPFSITVPQTMAPRISVVQTPFGADLTQFVAKFLLASGRTTTNVRVDAALDVDFDTTVPTTSLTIWQPDGSSFASPQAAIPSAVQGVSLQQLEFNGTDVVALTSSGVITTWQVISNSNAFVFDPTVTYRQIALGDHHLALLDSSGHVTLQGDNSNGQLTISNTAALDNIVAIDANGDTTLALHRSGRVYAWGDNSYGQTTVPVRATTNIVQIASGATHSLALRQNGDVVAWGNNTSGQTTVPNDIYDIVQIAAGRNHSLALRKDGTVSAWGSNSNGQITVPSTVVNAVYIAAGGNSSAAVLRDGTVITWGMITTPAITNAVHLAIADNALLIGQGANAVSYSNSTPAADSEVVMTYTVGGIIANHQYRYAVTAVNSAGITVQRDVLWTNYRPYRLFLPFGQNATPGTAPAGQSK